MRIEAWQKIWSMAAWRKGACFTVTKSMTRNGIKWEAMQDFHVGTFRLRIIVHEDVHLMAMRFVWCLKRTAHAMEIDGVSTPGTYYIVLYLTYIYYTYTIYHHKYTT